MRNATERAGFMRSNATDITFVMTGRMTRRVGRDTDKWGRHGSRDQDWHSDQRVQHGQRHRVQQRAR